MHLSFMQKLNVKWQTMYIDTYEIARVILLLEHLLFFDQSEVSTTRKKGL